jgi:hypothetical protein
MNKEPIFSYPNNKQENWVSYRNSEKFKNAITDLENLSVLGPQSKVVILSVALNIKQAADFTILFDQISPDRVEQILSDLGVYFSRNPESEKNEIEWNKRREGTFGCYVIGATPDAITEAVEAIESYPADDYHTKYGKAMEFPDTAIEAFNKSINTNNDELLLWNEDLLTDEEKAFTFFRYSKDNWQKEVEFVEQIIDGIKEYSPKIYAEVMNKKS